MIGLADTVSSHIARLVLDTAEHAGVAEAKIAHIASLDRTALRDNLGRIPTTDMHQLWEVLHHATGHEAGVRAAALAEPGRLHVWDYLIRTAPTLAEGLRDAAEFNTAICDPAMALRVAEDDARLTVDFGRTPYSPPIEATFSEFALATTIRRARETFGEAAAPVRVDFTHRAPRTHEYLEKALGVSNIHFEQERNGITFLHAGQPGNALGHDPFLREILRAYAKDLIEQARLAPPWLETVRSAIRTAMSDSAGRGVTVDEVARRLTLSGRTLQRRLAEHDTTWRRELDTARYELATILLRDPTRCVQSIAVQLGYSDHRTLARAFHRWTGQSPSAFRRSLRIGVS